MKTKTEAKHTPTPWEIGSDAQDRFAFIIGANGNTVINMNRVNAEFIVRAVNSHEALLAAAKDALSAIRGAGINTFAEDRLEEAIAKSEGEVRP